MLLLETFLKTDVLAIEPATWSRLVSLMELEARGGVKLGDAEITMRLDATAIGRSTPPRAASSGNIAVIPVTGLMFYRSGFLTTLLGWRGTAEIARDVRAAAEAVGVDAIVLEIDSGGGEVGGVQELADAVYAARARKPVFAAVNTRAGSAAFWVASQATEINVTPSGEIGGVGVLAVHDDVSKLQEKLGITTTLIGAGRFKTEANQYEPLGPEARASIQAKVNAYHQMFIDAVARGRGVTADTVRSSFGEGRMILARDAVARRMADRVATFDQTLARVLTSGTARTDVDLRRRRLALAEMSRSPRAGIAAAVDVDLERRRRRHRLAEATRR